MPPNDTGTTMQPTSLRERIDTVLQRAGLSSRPDEFDSSIHTWRCEHPDRYGRCTCFAELVDDLMRAVADDGTSARPTYEVHDLTDQEGDAIVTRQRETLTDDHLAAVVYDYSPDEEVTILRRPLTTVAELEALPYRAVILDSEGEAYRHASEPGDHAHIWMMLDEEGIFPSRGIALPAAVLWTPEEQS